LSAWRSVELHDQLAWHVVPHRYGVATLLSHRGNLLPAEPAVSLTAQVLAKQDAASRRP